MDSARRATSDDLTRILTLLRILTKEIETKRGGPTLLSIGPAPTPSPDVVAITSWLEEPDRVLMVGLFDGAVVGLGAGQVMATSNQGDPPSGLITACFVEPRARRVGVGTSLLSALLTWFEDQGCAAVDATALPGDRSAKQLYEAAGFKARALTLHRPIG